MIKLRAQHVEKGLINAYGSDVPGSFKVFCVDNKSYRLAAAKGDKAVDAVQESGVPAVRLFFHKISAHAQLLELRSMVSRLEETTNSIHLWKDPSKRDVTHDDFEDALKQAKKTIVRKISINHLLSSNGCRATRSMVSKNTSSRLWRMSLPICCQVSISLREE
jgi:hypothetical protein